MFDRTDLVPVAPDVEEAVQDAVKGKLADAFEEQFGESPPEYIDRELKELGFHVDDSPRADYKGRDDDHKVRYVLGEQYEGEMTVQEMAGRVGLDLGDLPLNGKTSVEIKELVVEVDLRKRTIDVNAVKIELEGSLHAEDASGEVKWGALGAKVKLEPYTFVPVGPFAARLGDPMSHGSVVGPGPGSPNVFIGGRPALRAGDTHTCPAATPLPHGPSAFLPSQVKVRINGRPALRQGDYVVEATGGPNVIVGGCPRVLVGTAPPEVDTYEIVVGEQRYLFRAKLGGVLDFGFHRLKAQGGLAMSETGKPSAKAGGEFDVAAVRGAAEAEFHLTVPLDFIDIDTPFGRIHPDAATASAEAKTELLFGTCGGKASTQKDKDGKRVKPHGGKGCKWVKPGETEIDVEHGVEMNETPGDRR